MFAQKKEKKCFHCPSFLYFEKPLDSRHQEATSLLFVCGDQQADKEEVMTSFRAFLTLVFPV